MEKSLGGFIGDLNKLHTHAARYRCNNDQRGSIFLLPGRKATKCRVVVGFSDGLGSNGDRLRKIGYT